MHWFGLSLTWYLYLFILGVCFFPLTKIIFKKFPLDFGYPFSKTLAIIFLSYSIYLLASLKILPFTRLFLFLILGIFIIINFTLFKRVKNKKHVVVSNLLFFIFEELLFLSSFLFLVFIRGQEPSIRGLEKFMDFGFINSILRGRYFPPLDIWLSSDNIHPDGYPINYYYFGHLTGAFLIKLTNFPSSVGYNLILATIFAQGITLVFSLVINLLYLYEKKTSFLKLIFFGLFGSYLVNLGGNLHSIYLFTKGYPNDNPVPFWQILSWFNPQSYWYPNATRFIPYTIHEFPSYSYVVADLHGHVFDIPFVLLTLTILFILFINYKDKKHQRIKNLKSLSLTLKQILKLDLSNFLKLTLTNFNQFQLILTIFLGFLTAVHYMTNAFDGPIYILLTSLIFFIFFRFSLTFFIFFFIFIFSFLFFSLPFSSHFKPFVTGIGVNCSPAFLTNIGHLDPFLFEKNNCQVSPLWMLFILWGFFWISFILFLLVKKENNQARYQISHLVFLLFSFGIFLTLIPEFFYIKDIYPNHFRANTMFKLGYQAFIIMSIASTIVFYLLKKQKKIIFIIIYLFLFFFVFIYPFFAFPSYYGKLDKIPQLNGTNWLEVYYPQDKEIINYLNKNITGQPVILEAQGDSYTDYERISANTGLPTVAGWLVHEWLWRGSADVVGKRIPDITTLYQSKDINLTINLIKKYQIQYVIISSMEREKYPNLNEEKFNLLGEKIFQSSNNLGAIYKIKIK